MVLGVAKALPLAQAAREQKKDQDRETPVLLRCQLYMTSLGPL